MSGTAPPSRPIVVAELIKVAERWLQQRGVPHFLADTEGFEHRVPHALIGTGFAAVCIAVLAYDHDGEPWGLEVAGAVAVLLLAFAGNVLWRRKEGKTGRFRWPRPGWMNEWIVATIVVAAAYDAVVEGVDVYVLVAVAVAVAALLAVTAATPIGSLRIAAWALGHPFREMAENAKVAAGALPLLLLTVAFLFPTSELWDAATFLSIPELVGTVGLFAGLGAAFLLVLGWARIGDVETFADWEAVRACLADRHPDPKTMSETEVKAALHSAEALADQAAVCEGVSALLAGNAAKHRLVLLRGAVSWPEHGKVGDVPPLDEKARWNITVVLVFGQVVQVLAVTVVMGVFFLLFGSLTVGHDTLKAWEVSPVDGWFGLTQQHWKVTAVLAAFAGLSYAVTASLFKDQREFFFGELDRKTLQRLGVRALYHRLLRM